MGSNGGRLVGDRWVLVSRYSPCVCGQCDGGVSGRGGRGRSERREGSGRVKKGEEGGRRRRRRRRRRKNDKKDGG